MRAMRPQTLAVSVAGVLAGTASSLTAGDFKTLPFIICLFFAIGAQITSNFANEYFDFRNGLDRRGRDGFRRGVTEGDISPKAMRCATFGTLAATCLLGTSLIIWGGWWLIAVGALIAIFALAYSAGPYPLSHHGWGEAAVILFFGFVPVIFTAYLQCGGWSALPMSAWLGGAIGLMGANVLIVNNYRDMEEDKAAGKRTLAVRYGLREMKWLYLVNGFVALLCVEAATALRFATLWQLGPLAYINLHVLLWRSMSHSRGAALNPLLGKTALLMFGIGLWVLLAAACGR